MSTKRPDVLATPPSALTALTLAEMHVRRWELKAACNRCPTKLKVSLPAMIRTHGPDAVFWDSDQAVQASTVRVAFCPTRFAPCAAEPGS